MFKTLLAYENWKSKYAYNNETPEETFRRVAKALASVEKVPEDWEDRFYRTMVKLINKMVGEAEQEEAVGLKCTTGGRITANAGTHYNGATLINCYINGPVTNAKIVYDRKNKETQLGYKVEINTEETPDNLHNIFLTILEQAKTLAAEGGYGINFSFIRPRGSVVKSIGIKHPGVVSYMDIWDSVSECIVKGDTDGYKDKIKNFLEDEKIIKDIETVVKKMPRKGAMMGVLNVWHPDIEEFVRAKQESGKLTKFNISVAVDDIFMKAVDENDYYDLHFNGVVYKRVKARDLYNLIMESTYNRAEPGILFVDNMHRNNPVSYLGKALCTNPCGEIPGISDLTTVCLLGSLNLTQYVNDDRTFDYDTFIEDIKIFTRMLDNVNDLASNPLPSYDWAVKNLRQIGMGINGLGSALIMLGIPYDSQEAIDFVRKICQIKENITWQTSALLAKEKGVFLAYNKELFESTEYFKSDRISEETKEMLRKYGARNAKTTTNPPLGNSSVICDNVSNGIEPVFSLEYERIRIVESWPDGLNKENVTTILKQHKKKDYTYWRGEYNGKVYYYEPHNRGLCEVKVIRDYGYNWIMEKFPNINHESYLQTTQRLKAEDHLAIQEVVQYFCNQSVSKTINLPKSYSFSSFKNLYIEAWKKGLNGLTTYREGSMEAVISSIENAEATREIIKGDIKLPTTFLNGPDTIIKREGIKFYIHFSYLPEDVEMRFPVCLWIYTNHKLTGGQLKYVNKAVENLTDLALKCGLDNKVVETALEKAKNDEAHNKLGRMISLCLRHNIPRDKVYIALSGIEGDNISTLLTAVRHYISNTIEDGTILSGIKCPECGGENVRMVSGCKQCGDCGYSACG